MLDPRNCRMQALQRRQKRNKVSKTMVVNMYILCYAASDTTLPVRSTSHGAMP